jgi:hypothetical protein
LQTGVIAFAGQAVHLEEPFVGALLNLDQVRDLDGGWDLGKIKTLTEGNILHSENSNVSAVWLRNQNRGMWGAHVAPELPRTRKDNKAPTGTGFPVGANYRALPILKMCRSAPVR